MGLLPDTQNCILRIWQEVQTVILIMEENVLCNFVFSMSNLHKENITTKETSPKLFGTYHNLGLDRHQILRQMHWSEYTSGILKE